MISLQKVTSSQLVLTQQMCEFDRIANPEELIQEGRINSDGTQRAHNYWMKEYKRFIGVEETQPLIHLNFPDVKVATFIKRTGETYKWSPHTRKKIMAALNGYFKVMIPPLANIYLFPLDWPRAHRVLMVCELKYIKQY